MTSYWPLPRVWTVDDNSRQQMYRLRAYLYMYGRARDATTNPLRPHPAHTLIVHNSRVMSIPMLCPVIDISELAQLVIDHLIDVSPESVVSLACTCKALEEQALRTLWSNQPIPLQTLVRSTLIPDMPHYTLQVQGAPYEQVSSIAVDVWLVSDHGLRLGVLTAHNGAVG